MKIINGKGRRVLCKLLDFLQCSLHIFIDLKTSETIHIFSEKGTLKGLMEEEPVPELR